MKKAMRAMTLFLLRILMGGGMLVMAMLLAQRIILAKMAFADVPDTLKEQVADILRDSGLDDLIGE